MSRRQALAGIGAYFALFDSGVRVWPADTYTDVRSGPMPDVEPGRCDPLALLELAPFGWAWIDPTIIAARAACGTN